jgi:hypothetical protein
LKEFVVNWFRNYAFGSHAGECLALAIVILVSFALCIASLRLVFWFLTCKRNADESEGEDEKEYWRVHGGEDTTLSNGGTAGVNLDVETENEATEIGVTAQDGKTSRQNSA